MRNNEPVNYEGELMKIGSEAEEVVISMFAQVMPQVQLEDVRDLAEWQRVDVDFRAHFPDGKIINLEVKSDQHITSKGNFVFELARITHEAEDCALLGWSVFSEAQRVLIWCPPSKILYVFHMTDYRKAMQRYTQEKRQEMRLSIITTDRARTTINILVPIKDVPYTMYTCPTGEWITVKNP
jgi:hypothetical protein